MAVSSNGLNDTVSSLGFDHGHDDFDMEFIDEMQHAELPIGLVAEEPSCARKPTPSVYRT